MGLDAEFLEVFISPKKILWLSFQIKSELKQIKYE
jgi:hypothetical protein